MKRTRQTQRAARGVAALAMAGTLALALAACGSSGAVDTSDAQSATAAHQDSVPGTPGAGGQQNPNEVLATIKGPDGRHHHDQLRQAGCRRLRHVSGTVKDTGSEAFTGASSWRGDEEALQKNGGSLAGATLVDLAGKKRYYVLRDTDGQCLCIDRPGHHPAGHHGAGLRAVPRTAGHHHAGRLRPADPADRVDRDLPVRPATMMSPPLPPPPSARPARPLLRLAAATSVVLLTAGALGVPATADSPSALLTSPSTPSVAVDPHAAGLKLLPGATLAAPKVLDIVSVVEDSNGDERRSDTPAAVTFDLQSEVLFGMDSSALSPDSSARIQAIADEIIRQNAKTVRVFGFTDNLGTHAHGVAALQAARRSGLHGAGQGSARRRHHAVPGTRLRRGVPHRRQLLRCRPQTEPPGRDHLPQERLGRGLRRRLRLRFELNLPRRMVAVPRTVTITPAARTSYPPAGTISRTTPRRSPHPAIAPAGASRT